MFALIASGLRPGADGLRGIRLGGCRALLVTALMMGSVKLAAQPGGLPVRGPQPNVVLIVADDLSPMLCNFLPEGRGKSLTPTLDRLAAEGVVLTQMHSPSPICTPSRFAILTGRYPSRATNASFLEETRRYGGQTAVAFNTHIGPTDDNLAKRLKAAGYVTGYFGYFAVGVPEDGRFVQLFVLMPDDTIVDDWTTDTIRLGDLVLRELGWIA